MIYWTYNALTRSGQEVTATLAGDKKDILCQLSRQELSVIEIKLDYRKIFVSLWKNKKLEVLSMAVFFEDFHNMLATGMSLPQILLILKETSKDEVLITMLSTLQEQLRQGQSLTEALAGSNIFPWMVGTTLSAGEKTGKLSEAVDILGQYFRRSHQVQSKMQEALIYPSIVFSLLLAVMFFISFRVIPGLKSLLPMEALHHQTTQWILTLSFLLQQYAWLMAAVIVLGILGIYFLQKKNHYRFQQWLYDWPVLGNILKESSLAIYLLNLSVLLKSGVALLKAIGDLSVLDRTPVAHHFDKSRDYLLGGSSFWQAIEQDKFFPVIISSVLRRAEEMVKVDEYCLSLADYLNRRVASKVDGLIHIIQPTLLALGGVFLVTIALAFLLPIYGSLTTIAGGG
ncbi:MAG: type II secretion system F family protein [Candidatus Omnitrophica bacterium]|nr:type II secretion system F family protein [Candidatus Omnitrophota bacterium]